MKLNKYIILISVILEALTTNAQEELNRYLNMAAENNPNLKAKFSEYHAALERIPQVGALPDPQVAFGYFIMPVETKVGPQEFKLGASQMFPWFGTLNANEDVATQMAKAKYEAFEEAKSKLFFHVKSTYFNLYFVKKGIDITKENIDILNTLQKLALIKIESGEASAVDELRVEMEILDLENQLLYLKDNLNSLEVSFYNLLNTDQSNAIEMPDTLWTDTFAVDKTSILDSIRINNHQVLSLEFQKTSFENQQIVAQKMGKPSFALGFDYTIVGESTNAALPATEFGKDILLLPKIGISIPIYRKKYTAMVQEAIYMQEATGNKKIDKENLLESSFEKTNVDYIDANRRITLHENQYKLAKKALRILETQYSTDGKNFEEILRMERQVLMHSLELEKARSDRNASHAFISYLMGK